MNRLYFSKVINISISFLNFFLVNINNYLLTSMTDDHKDTEKYCKSCTSRTEDRESGGQRERERKSMI
jgi:hypothetical protein